MKILIVDDEANARYGMAKAIRGGNRTILEADNGRTAIELIDRETPDLIFLDLQMPDLDGLGVLAELQNHSSVPETEIFVVTANDSITNAIECIKNGASDFWRSLMTWITFAQLSIVPKNESKWNNACANSSRRLQPKLTSVD